MNLNPQYWLALAQENARKAEAILAGDALTYAQREAFQVWVQAMRSFAMRIEPHHEETQWAKPLQSCTATS